MRLTHVVEGLLVLIPHVLNCFTMQLKNFRQARHICNPMCHILHIHGVDIFFNKYVHFVKGGLLSN